MESKELNCRRCCGMDVHQETVVVCVLPPDGQAGQPVKKVYGTFRNDLGRMRGWLKLLKVTEIAMESTGVYWRPLWNVLEGHGFDLILANPQQVKALHGRKSDLPSFVPPPEIRRLRELLGAAVSMATVPPWLLRKGTLSYRRPASCGPGRSREPWRSPGAESPPSFRARHS